MQNTEMNFTEPTPENLGVASRVLLLAFREAWDAYAVRSGKEPSREAPGDEEVIKAAELVISYELYRKVQRKYALDKEIYDIRFCPYEYEFPPVESCPVIPENLVCDWSAAQEFYDGEASDITWVIESILFDSYQEWFDGEAKISSEKSS